MKLPNTIKRGVITVADLKARSKVDAATHCWHWQGGIAGNGKPGIWTLNYATGEKGVLLGSQAVWNIAHGKAPLPGWITTMRCRVADCVNPSHVGEVSGYKGLGLQIKRSGAYKGINVEGKRQSLKAARAAAGIADTAPEMVEAIRAADRSISSQAVARSLGVNPGVVYDIRSGRTHRVAA